MARTNVKRVVKTRTHEGAPASIQSPLRELQRTVSSCLLFEDTFYEGGESIATRIVSLVQRVPVAQVEDLIVEARTRLHLRHVPLWLCACLAHNHTLTAEILAQAIQRPDEMGEFLSMYWREKRQPLSRQVKRGLAMAFPKFSAYQLAKYNQHKVVKLRDVLRLVHPKATTAGQGEIWAKLIKNELEAPDTWEVALSGGADKKETWERLLTEKSLGGLALLRNLRNMKQASVDKDLIKTAIQEHQFDRVLPFRFIAAARYAPELEPYLETALFRKAEELPKLEGPTVVLVDVSGSMTDTLSGKSDMRRIDAACGLAMLIRQLCSDVRVFSFAWETVEVPSRRGFALRDAICSSQDHGGTNLGDALRTMKKEAAGARLIVITDEQSRDQTSYPKTIKTGYAINVAPYQFGVTYGQWHHIDGFSERILDFIREVESPKGAV